MSKRPNPPNGGYWYGNAVTLFDGAGVEYLAGIAAYDSLPKTDPARFRFSVFRVGAGGVLTYLPLEDEASGLGGAGNIYVRSSDGQGRYGCTSAKVYYDGPIPGFAPFRSLISLQSQVAAFDKDLDALRLQFAGSPPSISGGVLRIGPQGGTAPLEGGQIELADGAGGWAVIDCRAGNLRIFVGGVEVQRWP